VNSWEVKIVALKLTATKTPKTAAAPITKTEYPIAAVKQISDQAKTPVTPAININNLLPSQQNNAPTNCGLNFITMNVRYWAIRSMAPFKTGQVALHYEPYPLKSRRIVLLRNSACH
jgi:hypothetical protein